MSMSKIKTPNDKKARIKKKPAKVAAASIKGHKPTKAFLTALRAVEAMNRVGKKKEEK